MIGKIKKIVNTNEKRRLLSNFFYLSILQIANYVLPIITLPYLVRVLGPEKYGLIAFCQAFIQYFSILTDYGFNLSATREIAIHRDDNEKVSEIFCSVMMIKMAFLLLSIILLTLIVFAFSKFRVDAKLYYLAFGTVVGQVFFPVWFFQGMEKMKYITMLNIASKGIFTVLVFFTIHNTSDYIYYPIINSLGFFVAAILAILIILKNFNIKFKIPKMYVIRHQLKEGWYIFISTVAISFYTISNTFILGLFTNNTIVGYYSGADKIIKAVESILSPVSQAVYPHISKIANESRAKAINFIRKIVLVTGGVNFALSLLIFVFAGTIVKILLGNEYIESINILRIMAFLPFIIGLSNIFGIQTMLTFDYKNAFSKILIAGSIMNIILSIIVVPLWKHIGTASAILVTEVFITVSMFIYLNRHGIKLLERKNA
jgi:PST family polysaccharide transporter